MAHCQAFVHPDLIALLGAVSQMARLSLGTEAEQGYEGNSSYGRAAVFCGYGPVVGFQHN